MSDECLLSEFPSQVSILLRFIFFSLLLIISIPVPEVRRSLSTHFQRLLLHSHISCFSQKKRKLLAIGHRKLLGRVDPLTMAYRDDQDAIFEQIYRCYPVSFIEKSNLEKGDKIIMPPSALDRLASLHIEYPMLFQLRNPSAGRVTHCGVLEFISDEGIIYIPYWMMENMLLQEGDTVSVKNTNLAKGTYVKLQPHTKEFLDISNPKAILETSLRSYSCLTTGDTIMVAYNSKKYYIDIVETKPSPAVSIIETDCEVDFAQPLDYKEPEKQAPSALFDRKRPEVEDEPATKIARFSPFTGSGRRLDGKPSAQSVEQTSSPKLKQRQTDNETKGSDSKSSNAASRRPSGKLVFGSNATTPDIQTPPKASLKNTSQESSQKEEEPKFQAFTGKKYSLKS